MSTAEPNPELSYPELTRIVDQNCAPFETLEQCNRYIKAANMLWRREPSETDQDGTRVSKRDLEVQIAKAEKAREVFLLNSRRTTVIVPADCLR